ncbi:MAG: glycosyltransferase family 2 protein [Candidatus Gottesmanbacteria bacterium]|nr:glycosyltransferase family 2 protein [Candidatus Gottesmanbacteria bacterium]
MINLTLIIALYNAKKTIRHVVETAKRIPEIKEIIVVDDGSTDGSTEIIKSIRGIKTIFHQSNLGKGDAIASGIHARSHNLVLLVDDDLRTIRPLHIQNMIHAYVGSGADMLIAARERKSIFDWLTGERLFDARVIDPYLGVMKSSGFGVEQIINYAHRNKKVKIIYSYGIGHTFKYRQYSWGEATRSYLVENWHMIKFFVWEHTNRIKIN